MNRKNPAFGYGNDVVTGVACFIVDDGGNLDPAPQSQFPRIANLALTGNHTGLGIYSCVLQDGGPQELDIVPTVVGAATSAYVTTEYNPATRTVVIETRTPAGVLVDLTLLPQQQLRLLCIMRDSTA